VKEFIPDAVLSQGGPRDAAINFDTNRILERHVWFLCHVTDFLLVFVCRLSKSDKY